MTVAPRPWTGDAASYLEGTARLVDALEDRVGAFTDLDRGLLASGPAPASGPLAGMPVAVKEIIDVAGRPTTFGSPLFADRVPERDATAVARLRTAGAAVLGMTTTTPFACGTTTATDNPRAPGRTPGGSSAGSGAAVGAGYVPLALASQSQASTLRPASYCGAWGFKPSHGRLPTDGMHLLAEVLDDLGLIAASISDLRTGFGVLAEPRTEPAADVAELRIGRLRLDDGGLPDAATLAALDGVVERIGERFPVASGTPELAAVDAVLEGSGTTCFDLFAGQSAATLAAYVEAGEPLLWIHHADVGVDDARRRLEAAWQIGDAPPAVRPLVLDRIG